MFYQRSTEGREMLWCLLYLTWVCTLHIEKNEAVKMYPPKSSDFAECELTQEEKEKFMDEHNRLRGKVFPEAADMEYLLWDSNLANLAQMWVNKCIWDHGFLFFGDEYPKEKNATFTEQLGQNLARETGQLETPEDRVERWFNESHYYRYSKYTSSTAGDCSKTPCGHYTQLAWAKVKYVGCAKTFCRNFFSNGGTFVACDYGPKSGNVIGEYPYQDGTPCSNCASGSGFCYKKLCRDCADFDYHCGLTGFPESMCATHPDLMEKTCPKLCKMCKCPLQCRNGGTLNEVKCICSCRQGWTSTDCSAQCYDKKGKQTCQQYVKYNVGGCSGKWASYFKENCEATCGYCDDGSGTYTTTVSPVVTTTPALRVTTPAPAVTTPTNPIPPSASIAPPPTKAPQVICNADMDPSCAGWAAIGWCEKNKEWMIPNCCVSCKYHQAPAECKDLEATKCPLWAYQGECYSNSVWMLANCRKSCNQCGECKDTDPKCPSWALLKECHKGDRVTWMNTNCRRSCGLCQVYDKHAECPAWEVMGNCKNSNWTWMADHCPRSCKIPLSEVLFCGGKWNGDYKAPSSCTAYVACSHEVTSHVNCPPGEEFNTLTRMCKPADEASCTIADMIKTSPYKIVTTLRRG
ncbi:uncharacterized protein [Montipora capricornis]|uniref:uncharacterized protein n=1 Tax=Montipora capricornis TaxID=246305 RepID=UPI0035F18811